MKKIIFILLIAAIAIAETVISPNMNLTVPVTGVTPGPQWANDINSCMTTIDQHDHTPGNGVPISSSALSITSDLSLDNNALTDVEAVVFTAQSSFGSNQAVYVISPDLIYNDGNGNVVRITQNGSVSGSSGTITGLPSGTASASYQAGSGTFQFQSSTNTPANGSFASVVIAQQTTSPNIITLKSPTSLASSYNVTFPTAVPSFTSLLTMSTSGVLSTVAYKAPTVQKFTSGSGTYTLPTSPSPLYIRLIMVGGGGGGGGNTSDGGAGGDSTFGSNTAGGGGGGQAVAADYGGAGGTPTLAAGFSGVATAGGGGGGGGGDSGTPVSGGAGGSSALGGGARATLTPNTAGSAGGTNSGGGGSGSSSLTSSTGGGGGAYINAIATSPSSTYAYSVGAAGAAGTGSQDGGAGGSGLIVVEEYYQ